MICFYFINQSRQNLKEIYYIHFQAIAKSTDTTQEVHFIKYDQRASVLQFLPSSASVLDRNSVKPSAIACNRNLSFIRYFNQVNHLS